VPLAASRSANIGQHPRPTAGRDEPGHDGIGGWPALLVRLLETQPSGSLLSTAIERGRDLNLAVAQPFSESATKLVWPSSNTAAVPTSTLAILAWKASSTHGASDAVSSFFSASDRCAHWAASSPPESALSSVTSRSRSSADASDPRTGLDGLASPPRRAWPP
jgi:hypothetical protein